MFEENFYLSLTIKDKNGDVKKEISVGNSQYQKQCEIVYDTKNSEKLKAASYARCYAAEESVSYFDEGYRVEGSMSFLSASNNAGKRISIV